MCSRLAEGAGYGGLPDLVLWREAPVRTARAVEVKSANDTLSDDQRAWALELKRRGVEVCVCRVA